MAGEWIKMRTDLLEDPVVFKLASLLKTDRLTIIGRLYAFWAWADKHAVDGRVDGASSLIVDDITRCDGFAAALVAVKWLTLTDDSIALPKHERHNGESAKERAMKNARQARWREGKDSKQSTDVDAAPSTKPSTREEKRREEKKEYQPPSVVKRATRKCPDDFCVTEDLYQWAAGNTPLVDLKSATEKFRDHTFKTAISDWPGAWRNWLRRDQEQIIARPARVNGTGETAYQRSMREKYEIATGQKRPQHGEVIDVAPLALG